MRTNEIPQIGTVVKKISAASPELAGNMKQLVDGTIMALEITDFVNPAFCGALVDILLKYPQDTTYLANKATKILFSQHNKRDDPDEYFAGAENHPLLREWPMKVAIAMIMKLLRSGGKNVNVAYDPVRKKHYCPVIIREFHSTLLLHQDLASREAVGWNPIEKVNRQLAFVLKLTACEGGATRWFPRQWRPEDQKFFNYEDNYSFDEAVVDGYPEVKFEGAIGTLIVFDCTAYHAVEPVIQGRRFTLGGFAGLLEDTDEFVIWS